MNRIFLFAMAALVTASCNNSSSGKASTETALPENNIPASTVTSNVSVSDSNNPVILNANTNQAVPVSNTNSSGSNQGSVALNPKHGQPGHRCDIPEGAPLNSPAANTTTPVVQTTPVVNNQQPVAQPASGKLRINPPHGEPGHDCSVQVGQPLKN